MLLGPFIVKNCLLFIRTRKASNAFPPCIFIHSVSGALISIIILSWLCKTLAGQQGFLANSVAWYVPVCPVCLNTWMLTFNKKKNANLNVMNVDVVTGMPVA